MPMGRSYSKISSFCLLLAAWRMGPLFGSAIGALAGSLVYQGEGDFFKSTRNFSDENLGIPLMTMQGIASVFTFFVFPYLAWSHIRKKKFNYFNSQNFYLPSLPLVIGLVILFGIADSAIIEWNQNIHFPGFLKPFETWARAKEDELAMMTKVLTHFHSIS